MIQGSSLSDTHQCDRQTLRNTSLPHPFSDSLTMFSHGVAVVNVKEKEETDKKEVFILRYAGT